MGRWRGIDQELTNYWTMFVCKVLPWRFCAVFSEGEKPPKIRKKKKSSQEQSSWEPFFSPPTEKTEKIGKIKGTLVRKVPGKPPFPGICFFFLVRFFCPLVFLLARTHAKSGSLEVDQELDMGCQLWTRTFPCWNCRGSFLQMSSGSGNTQESLW